MEIPIRENLTNLFSFCDGLIFGLQIYETYVIVHPVLQFCGNPSRGLAIRGQTKYALIFGLINLIQF